MPCSCSWLPGARSRIRLFPRRLDPAQSPSYAAAVNSIHTLRVEVQQYFPKSGFLPISDTVERLLAAVGVQTAGESGPADATLTISLTFTPLGEYYGEAAMCYQGAKSNGELTLTPAQGKALTLPLADRLSPNRGLVITLHPGTHCPKEAPYDQVWPKPVLAALAQLWGDAVLVEALDDPAPSVQYCGAWLLSSTGGQEASAQVVAHWIDNMESEDESERLTAVTMLNQAGPEAPGVIAALIRALQDESSSVREIAAGGLRDMGSKAAKAVPALIQALQDPSAAVRDAAVHALGRIGPAAREAVPLLIYALSDPATQEGAQYALEQITGQKLGSSPGAWQAWWGTPAVPATPLANWEGIPLMPGASPTKRTEGQLNFSVQATCRQVVDFYEAALPGLGWEWSGGDASYTSRYFRKDKSQVHFALDESASGCDVEILYSR